MIHIWLVREQFSTTESSGFINVIIYPSIFWHTEERWVCPSFKSWLVFFAYVRHVTGQMVVFYAGYSKLCRKIHTVYSNTWTTAALRRRRRWECIRDLQLSLIVFEYQILLWLLSWSCWAEAFPSENNLDILKPVKKWMVLLKGWWYKTRHDDDDGPSIVWDFNQHFHTVVLLQLQTFSSR